MKPNRRQFVRAAALGIPAAAGLGVAGTEAAQDDRPADEARLLTELVAARYPKRLDEAALKRVQGKIASGLASARALGQMPLTNGDEPDFVFFAEEP